MSKLIFFYKKYQVVLVTIVLVIKKYTHLENFIIN